MCQRYYILALLVLPNANARRVGCIASMTFCFGRIVRFRLFIPRGPKVVPFWGSYLEFYKVIPKRNYFGAYGYLGREASED